MATLIHDPLTWWAAGLLALGILVWARRAVQRRSAFRLFDLSARQFRLLGTDIAGSTRPLYLRFKQLVGAPDAGFISRDKQQGFIGEYKSRDYKGYVKHRERYQVILYMGMLKNRYGLAQVSGAIRYRDHLEPITFDPSLFDQLLALQAEYRSVIQGWQIQNDKPLYQRSR